MIIIYLDVDGVINAVGSNTEAAATATGLEDYRLTTACGWQIMYSTQLVGILNRWAQDPDVTIKWVTTWDHDAAQSLCPAIGLRGEEWEVLCGDQQDWYGRHWWKLAAVRSDVQGDQPEWALWIDDDIAFEEDATNWVDTQQSVHSISPVTSQGITRAHVAQVELMMKMVRSRRGELSRSEQLAVTNEHMR